MAPEGYARPDLLVETDWLATHLQDPNLRVVDCDVPDMYRRAHIRNAVSIPEHHYIKHPSYENNPKGYPLVMPPEPFARLMERMGIGDNTLVVAYDVSGSLYAARFWWVLNHYGHTQVRVLNGGWDKWFGEGRPMSVEAPRPPKATFTPHQDPHLVCTLDYGVSRVGKLETVFLDVRTDAEWEGTNDRGNQRAGHVPGAVHIEWSRFVASDRPRTFRPAQELRTMLEAQGVTPDKEVITY
ncbi:MAG: sulfurtransferase [Chloroflexi bacterium]|nr:sulfurtransferase [Chloroflexota bacterium]